MRDRVRRFLERPGTVDLAVARALLPRIAEREPDVEALSDARLAAAVERLRTEPRGDDWLVELCALGREAARRALGERPYDVQLLGTLELLSGRVVEMATGEGKTLAGAIAAAGYVLRGHRVHVMSVNDYLAERDAEWMRPLYALLGVRVGSVDQSSTAEERRTAYAADVTYAPVSEVGFDVMRDRMVTDLADRVLPEPEVALVDEADSVLVDEARVPLVLAGAADQPEVDAELAAVVRGLRRGKHFQLDEDGRNAYFTPTGIAAVEHALGVDDLYGPAHVGTLAAANIALHARALLRKDVDYVVRDGKVQLVDDSRGRIAILQRWPDGLQAAVEAKEGLSSSGSGEVLDTITVHALMHRYPTVCGMTGTAVAAGEQLREFYQLEVAVIPPNRPCVRVDEPDRVYDTVHDKEQAIVTEIAAVHETGRPILVGTHSVAESEKLSARLARADVPCVVLNAKNDAQEAAVIAEAGAYGAVTVSTQMAGRGTDIRLGGADGSHDRERVVELGGLYVLATARHASSRVDDQLRGRSGRQGDPGGSVVFASLEDEIVVKYAPEAEAPSQPDADGRIDDPKALHIVEHAQRVAEGVNLEIYRGTWRYNGLLEGQRALLGERREAVLRTEAALEDLEKRCPARYAELTETVDHDVLVSAARQIALYHLDRAWADHLGFLADLREGIHLRALARENPLDAFNRESIKAFDLVMADTEKSIAAAFETATITADGVDLDRMGLKRPTATWTYLVGDNPFGTEAERILKWLGKKGG
ncbi:MAG: accessory Sec system translocase SecA2 [Streptosporangiales bacterium]|nr:accessory Sec system translocase SecA2 [Streptosporangiales bacterium]